jgi:CRISPR-associated protein (TIGR03984 family)
MTISVQITEVAIDEKFFSDLRGWLTAKATQGMPWLLVHADDGVIWGRCGADGSLLLSSDVFDVKSRYPSVAVELRTETLQQARIFGKIGEILVWRNGTEFKAREIADGEPTPEDAFEEQHLLWGQGQPAPSQKGFTLLVEGEQGPCHAVPAVVKDRRRPALKVRHYADYDSDGQAFICLSRLVDLVTD